jgi:hypothetical protein
MKFCTTVGPEEHVTIRAGPAWVVLAGLIQASTVKALLAFSAEMTLAAEAADRITVDELTDNPPPDSQVTAPVF